MITYKLVSRVMVERIAIHLACIQVHNSLANWMHANVGLVDALLARVAAVLVMCVSHALHMICDHVWHVGSLVACCRSTDPLAAIVCRCHSDGTSLGIERR